ncbi:tetratricopeptide repeat protein [Streptomyces soliscabiei]|uniref:tetratricopeptide repeat protein n=1 Tax=Streptomyces soliscabiei TaxID=588897 RepID=UPI00299F95C7|nr:tetratricopeptide repeat protein [Streptomyces sp. NY05-11A]MDX2676774.1 tetratricopeptide repeat protein [Streptomyces sp. NY05-11A]
MRNEISDGIFFNAVIQGQNVTMQLPPAIPLALSGIPRRSSTFVGRTRELEQMAASLSPKPSQGATVLTVTGMPGVGKTELVLQLADKAAKENDWFPGGVLFIDLAGYSKERKILPGDALASLLRSLGVPSEVIPEETQDRARIYRSVLQSYAQQERRLLVIIDNAKSTEHASLLLPADDVNAALVTSRINLDIDAPMYTLQVLPPESAVDVIRSVLRTYRGTGDVRADQEIGATLRVAQLCGFLPLALQIAAALLADSPNRPVEDLADELADAHARLDTLAREKRAVRAVFDLSYEALSEEHARLFRLLPINGGPDVSTEAAAQLANSEKRATGRALELLARAHLIESSSVWGRWRMHDLLRLYADERGAAKEYEGERSASIQRLVNFYADASEAADFILRGRASEAEHQHFKRRLGDPLKWFEDEESNLISSTQLAAGSSLSEAAYNIAINLGLYLDIRRRVGDSLSVARTALRAARQAKNKDWQAGSLNHIGLSLSNVGRFSEAIEVLREGIKLAREAGSREIECDCLLALGAAQQKLRKPESAVDALRRALAIGEDLRNPIIIGTALTNLGNVYRESGSPSEAAYAYSLSIEYHRASGDRRKEASGHSGLAAALSQSGQFREAFPHFGEAIRIYDELGDRHGLAIARMNLGNAHMRMGNYRKAKKFLEQARANYQESSDGPGEGMTLLNMAHLERAAGNYTLAQAYAEEGNRLLKAR